MMKPNYSNSSFVSMAGVAFFIAVIGTFTSDRTETIAAYAASGAFSSQEMMELFISPLFEGHEEEYQAFREYVYEGIEPEEENINKNEETLIKEIQKESTNFDKAGKAAPPRDPLAIDFGETGINLTKLENGVYFDLDNNGFAEKTAWIGAEDGFLALDVNGNGKIDNGSELFGDRFIMSNNKTSLFGFEALIDFDDNKDNQIDENLPSYTVVRDTICKGCG